MRTLDVLMAFPGVLLGIAIVTVLGPSMHNLIVAIVVTSIPAFGRLVRAQTLAVREDEYVTAAVSLGASQGWTIRRHILPNIMPPLAAWITLRASASFLAAAALSFLGLGVQPPTPEWGAMVSSGRTYIQSAPHLVLFPGAAIVLLVLAVNFLGDTLVDHFIGGADATSE
jgi:peptide/nickel transport system permease protein